MAFGKLVNLFALSSLAIIVCSYGAAPANALALDGHDAMKVKRVHGHDGIAKKKRSNRKRQDGSTSSCRTRTGTDTSSPTATSSSSDSDTAASTTAAADGSSSSSDSSSPSSTTSSSAAASSTAASSGNGSGKLGLAWGGDNSNIANFVKQGRTQYFYNWAAECPQEAKDAGLTCIPQLWGLDGTRTSAWTSTVTAGYANLIAGFNEINEAGQSNLDPATAASGWQQYIQPLASQGAKTIAPVTSSNPDGIGQIQQFMSDCSGCTIDYIAVHYYGTNASAMIEYIQDWETTFNKPVFVTEFACQNYNTAYENNGQQCSQDQVWDFYKTAVEYMESDSNVVAYFPFGLMNDMSGVNTLDQLMSSSNSGTDLWNAILNLSF